MTRSVEYLVATGSYNSPRLEKRRINVQIPPGIFVTVSTINETNLNFGLYFLSGIEDGQTLRVGVEGNQEIFVTGITALYVMIIL